MRKGEALQLAKQEISRVLIEHSENDTTYLNETENLKVNRIIYKDENINRVEILVSRTNTDSSIVSLKASYAK